MPEKNVKKTMAEKYYFTSFQLLNSSVSLIFRCGLKDNDEKRVHSKAK